MELIAQINGAVNSFVLGGPPRFFFVASVFS